MLPLSVVIVAHNEAHNIVRCVEAVMALSNDVLVAVNNCNDGTEDLARNAGARVIQLNWTGYSNTKNEANAHAKNNWILSLDADEVVTELLRASILDTFRTLPSNHKVFSIKRLLVYNGQILKYGSVSSEYRPRVFNRLVTKWNQNKVHEELEFIQVVNIQKLEGNVLHYSYQDEEDHKFRLEKYAKLFAQHMHEKGKKSPWFKRTFGPLFGFIKNYIFRLGFLDGINGLKHAMVEFGYTRNKYKWLHQLNNTKY